MALIRGPGSSQTLRKTVIEGGRSVLMSSHVMDDVERVCDRIVMIHKGKIVVHRSIDDMVKQVEKGNRNLSLGRSISDGK